MIVVNPQQTLNCEIINTNISICEIFITDVRNYEITSFRTGRIPKSIIQIWGIVKYKDDRFEISRTNIWYYEIDGTTWSIVKYRVQIWSIVKSTAQG